MTRKLITTSPAPAAGSLLGIQQRAVRGEIRYLEVDILERSPFQPRVSILRDEAFEALVASVSEHGVLQPLVVRELENGRLELLAGERRLEASKACGKSTVPARVLTGISDWAAQGIALTENLARVDLSAWEQAQTMAKLKALCVAQGRENDVRSLGQAAGLSKSLVADLLVIAERLDQRVLNAVSENSAPLTLEKLSKAKLLRAAKRDDPKARAFALTGMLTGKQSTIVSAPFVMSGSVDASLSIRIARPVATLTAEEAVVLLDKLRPVVTALQAVLETVKGS